MSQGERRLAAIMFTDMVGYTALGQKDESLSLALVEDQRRLIRSILPRHNGREVKTIGDAFLVEFPSALEAVNCAVEIQSSVEDSSRTSTEDRQFKVRIGIHLGDVIHQGTDVAGDAVNVAARIEPLAPPGGVCVSEQVYLSVVNKVERRFESLGVPDLKNVSAQVEVYQVVGLGEKVGKLIPRKAAPTSGRIAILPFVNISPDKDDDYFADGMTEELIATMSRISELRVIARTSVMSYKGGKKRIDEIANELGVGTVLEGSVRKAGERLRITVQLVDAQTSHHLWSESYDRELRDVFAVQSDISKAVAEALRVKLIPAEKARLERTQEVSPEGFTLYLKGRFYWNERTKEGLDRAVGYFERAIKADPQLAVAYSGLADCYNIMADYFWMPPDRAGPLALDCSKKALEINDDLAEAHASLALTFMNYAWDFASAERELKRAIELRPNYATAHQWYGTLMFYLRRHADYYLHEKQALELDPYSRVINMNLANSLALLGRTNEAMGRYDKLIEQNPDFPAVHTWKADVHAWLLEYDSAIEEATKALNLDRTTYAQLNLAGILAKAGKKEESSRTLEDVLAHAAEKYVSPVQVGGVKLAMGLRDEGYEWLEKGLAQRDASLLYFRSYPWTEKYRSDPRWKELDARLSLPRES